MNRIIKRNNITIYNYKNLTISNNSLFKKILKYNNSNNTIYISGGTSLNLLLKKIKKKKIKLLPNFFLTDERVSRSFKETNIYNIKKLLFKKFIKFDYLSIKNISACINYSNKKLPRANLIIFGVGNDGHIASIFKNENSKNNFFIKKKKNENYKRISISKNFIHKSDEIFFFINKKEKNIFIKSLLTKNKKKLMVPFVEICRKYKKKISIFTYKFSNLKRTKFSYINLL